MNVIDIEKLAELGIEALQRAHQDHNQLGEEGKKSKRKNAFGEIALKADIQCEEAILDFLREKEFPAIVHSEEHGEVTLKEPKFTAMLDGLDGSVAYRKGEGRYSTMFGIFEGTDPTYNDYIFCGVMEHTTGNLYFAIKGEGSFVIENGERTPIKTSPVNGKHKDLLANARFYVDIEFDNVTGTRIIQDNFLSKLPGFNIKSELSSAAHWTDLASGEADVVLECARKGNLELAVGYGLVTEAGGVVVGLNNVSIGDKKYNLWGQGRKNYVPFIAAATPELAREVTRALTKPRL